MTDMSIGEVQHYISTLAFPDEPAPVGVNRLTGAVDTASVVKASMAGNTLITFLGDLPRGTREDVENSFEFASLAADAKFKQEGGEWIAYYLGTLKRIGWTPVREFNSTTQVTNRGLTMDKVALDLIGSLVGVTGLAGPGLSQAVVLKAVSSTIEALGKQAGPLKLFKERTASGKSSGFQAVVCNVAANGSVQVKIGCVRCQANLNHTEVLFFNWSTNAVETVSAEADMSLNFDFEHYREVLRKRLKEKKINYIFNVDLGDD